MLQRFDLQGSIAIGYFDAHTAARRQRHDLVGREFALVETSSISARHCRSLRPARLCNPSFTLREKCLVPSAVERQRQRFYARKAAKTTFQDNVTAARRPSAPGSARTADAIDLGHPAHPSRSDPIHPAPNSFADECRGMLVHLAVYVGALALLVILGAHLWGICLTARV